MTPPTALIFDLDDTLIVDDPATLQALDATARFAASRVVVDAGRLAEAARRFCLEIWEQSRWFDYCERLGIHGYECLWGRFEPPPSEMAALSEWCSHFRAGIWNRALSECGIEDHGLASVLSDLFGKERRERFIWMDGALELLETLRGNFRLGLLTNGAPSLQREKIAAFGLESYFGTIVISGEIGIGKPAPEIFEETVSRLQLSPAECVMVGNSLTRDIAGATAAGLRSIWLHVPGCGDEGANTADATVSGLAELPAVIQSLLLHWRVQAP